MKIAEALGLLDSVWKLVFVSAYRGCIELTFSIPRPILDTLKSQLKLHSEFSISKQGFTKLENSGIHILCGPPGKPCATTIAIDCVAFQWTKPEFEGFYPLQHYFILYRSDMDPPTRWRILQTKCPTEKWEIKQLPQNRSPFFFKVQAVSDIGAGLQSESSDPIDLVKPSESKKSSWNTNIPSKPGKPRAFNATHDTIHLEWIKPALGANSIISYTILYRSTYDRPNHWMEQRAMTMKEEAAISQLSEKTTYVFVVEPKCEAGVGVESDFSEPITTKMIIPSKPGKPIATNVTHDSIQLEWTKPQQGAYNITAYNVFFCSHTDNDSPDKWIEQKIKAAEERTTVSQLLERTIYSFKVQPECGDGFGLMSDISEPITTKMFISSKAGKPIATNVTHDSIQLEWTKPEEGAHNIVSYKVPNVTHDSVQLEWQRTIEVQTEGRNPSTSRQVPIRLTSSDIPKVLENVWEARQKWYSIGIQLKLKASDLDVIRQQGNNNGPDDFVIEMVKIWLRQGGATWEALIDALKHETVGYPILASNIAALGYSESDTNECRIDARLSSKPRFKCPKCNNCSFKQFLEGECPEFKLAPNSAFPYLDTENLAENERLSFQVHLCEETQTIITEFSNLIFHMSESFKSKKIDSQDVATTGIATCESSTVCLMESFDIETLHSVDALMGHLLQNGYISIFNYHIVQNLINKYGTDKDKEEFGKYEAKFKMFCKRSTFEIPTYIFGTVPSDGEILAFKVTSKMLVNLRSSNSLSNDSVSPIAPTISQKTLSETLHLSLENTLSIQMKVAEALGLLDSVWSVVFVNAHRGCIDSELTFSIPRSIMNTLEPQLKLHSEFKKSFADLESSGIHVLCGPPGKPYATTIALDSVTFQWTKPEFEGFYPLQHYFILYRSDMDPPTRWRILQTKCPTEKWEIKQLPQNRSPFFFKVQAVSDIGAGLQSESSDPIDLVKPSESKKSSWNTNIPSKPGKPRAFNATHDTIHLEWIKPALGANSIISYTILYRSTYDRPNHWMEQRAMTMKEEAAISQLSEKTTYVFVVEPKCEAGVGVESDFSEPITTKMIIPSKPGKPIATNVTHDSIQLEWTKPQQGAYNITAYNVFFCSHTDNDSPDKWIEQKIKAAEERTTVSQLLERTIYSFKVQPECGDGFGLMSDISEPITTKMFISSKAGKPIATNVTHDSIQLEWTKPEEGAHNIVSYKIPNVTHDSVQLEWTKPAQGAHNIISYTVFYRSTSDPPDMWSEHKAVTNEEVLLPQLSENTIYYFKIRPECEAGIELESDVSDPIQTNMIIPSKPGKPKASSITHNSIQLEWTKPEEGAHNVTSYVIFYRSASDPPDQWIQLKIGTAKEKYTVSHLSENAIYSFKIQPEYEGGVGTESDVSDFVKTDGLLLSLVVKKLWDARGKWYYIGLCLGVDKTDLENNFHQDTDFCFRKMLTLWLNQVNGTWQMLIDALHDKTVGYHSLADSIKAEFLSLASLPICGGSIQSGKGFKCPDCGTSLEKHLSRECPILLSSSDSAFPFLDTNKLTEDEKLNLHVKLIKETDNMNDKFNDLVDEMTESFDKMPNKELQKVANFVRNRFSTSSPSLALNSASAIIQYLREKMSFYNYHNLQCVIAKFGTDKDKEKLSAYEMCFKNFCKRSVFEVPEAVFGAPPDCGQMLVFNQIIKSLRPTCDHGLPTYHHTVIKSAKTVQMSLSDALKVQMKIAEVLGIENVGDLVFLGASKGCIKLKFSVPIANLDEVKEKYNVETLTELPGFADLEAANIHILCGPPSKLCAINVTSNSIHLQWSKPEYQGSYPFQHYSVHYKSLKDPSAKWRTVQSKAIVENLEIGGLPHNETPFIFKVQAVNEIGAGIPSENSDPIDLMQPLLIEIPEKFPSKPGKPQALSITRDSIQLEWIKPDIGVKSITSYTIFYHAQFNDPPNQWMEIRSANTKVIVSQLLDNTTYLFLVQPECEAGIGLESDVSDPIKTMMIIPSKPGKPRALKITHDSVKLEWTKPEQGAHNVTSYSVLCRSTSDPADYWMEYKAVTTEEKVCISQLRENTLYYFMIEPQCADGYGLQSDVSDPISTDMMITSQPGKPRCMGITHNSIQLEWTKPEQGAHSITSYTIFYHSTTDPSDVWMRQNVKPPEEKLTVSELSQNTIYLFKVRPECSDKFGSESDTSEPIKTMTVTSIPSEPTASTVSFKFKDMSVS